MNTREDRKVKVVIQIQGRDCVIPILVKNFQELKERKSICRGCGGEIAWGITQKEKRMPIEPKGSWEIALADKDASWETHWAICPASKNFRKK